MGRNRGLSFHDVDPHETSGILDEILKESNAYMGGASMGKGLKKAAQHYLDQRFAKVSSTNPMKSILELPGAGLLSADCNSNPNEEPFYIMDIGVLVSQVYQWRRFFPRVEPFYAVKCNPDPVILKTLAILGCNFDCASRSEIRLVEQASRDLSRKPEIVYANPCKAKVHLIEAVCKGFRMVTFDNATEIQKCASISKHIQLILRIATDDRGSRCRFSTKFGAPRYKWKPLLAAAKKYGLSVVGVSFHVGSGCRDASKYELALKDSKEIFDMAEKEFGMKMTILDIGGGFPGETHSLWNPAAEIDHRNIQEEKEGIEADGKEDEDENHFMFFTEIAAEVAPAIDRYFPESSGVRLIAEPGRYFAAAAATLCCSVVSARSSVFDASFEDSPVNDQKAAAAMHDMTRQDEVDVVHRRVRSKEQSDAMSDAAFSHIQDELADYSKLYATQQLAQQEFDVYNDKLNLYEEGFETAVDLLGPPEPHQLTTQLHTVEGMNYPLVAASADLENGDPDKSAMISLVAAGEAAVKGMMLQAVVDTSELQDDYAYYVNDGVYGAFNNLMFDHASVRPRVLRVDPNCDNNKMDAHGDTSSDDEKTVTGELFASTVFGPTCDSIDVIARSALLPKLEVGDWMYFQNMGAYTMAAASSFNGFDPSEVFYVCSVQPEYFDSIIKEISRDKGDEAGEEKKGFR
ncbi:unnamed protein product [Cylindrotheca closterium]|uniref:ornithine decarboxylase n=1 Tax=Cylindrotheca closterium TaxID=2856 RepID=A0AAD2FV48_9STRA|nr:unnamed protein product [Cylindrotheca closterium]